MKPTDMPTLESYNSTPTFTESSVPAGLLADHSTKDGVWGLIHVTQGRLRYCITDPGRNPEEWELNPDSDPGVVEPTILHRVEPMGPVQFHVEFLRTPTSNAAARTPSKQTKS